MAAKKTKKVTIEIDVEDLEKLAEAAGALSEIATALSFGVDDPAVKARLQKKAKRSRR